MKPLRLLALLTATLLVFAPGGSVRAQDESERQKIAEVTAAFQTVFYAVLEGCFTDGLTDADVDQLLHSETPDQKPDLFIYACPICTATEEALRSYCGRSPTHKKSGGKITFGQGLTPEMHTRVYSADLRERLAAIHDLEQGWVARRVASLRLDPEELSRTQAQLELARSLGTSALQSFLQNGTARDFAPGYHEGDECALCNAATGMKLKLAPAQP